MVVVHAIHDVESAEDGTAVDFEKATKAHREFIVSVSRELFVKDGSMVRKKKKDASDVEKAVAEISNLAFLRWNFSVENTEILTMKILRKERAMNKNCMRTNNWLRRPNTSCLARKSAPHFSARHCEARF